MEGSKGDWEITEAPEKILKNFWAFWSFKKILKLENNFEKILEAFFSSKVFLKNFRKNVELEKNLGKITKKFLSSKIIF